MLFRSKRGHLWTYVRDGTAWGSTDPPAVWYQYSPSWHGRYPQKHLASFEGKLQVDAYAGFEPLFLPTKPGVAARIEEISCMAHCPEPRFIWGASDVTAEILGQRRSMTPDNSRSPIRWRRGRQAGPAWATRRVCEWAKGRRGPRNARGHRASSVSWCSRSGLWSRCWHVQGSRGLPLYRRPLAIMRPRNCGGYISLDIDITPLPSICFAPGSTSTPSARGSDTSLWTRPTYTLRLIWT